MKLDVLKRMESELADWRTKLDTLRVKAHLGKMELEDKQEEILEAFEPAYNAAEKKLREVKDAGEDRVVALAKGLSAGWSELRATYKEVVAQRKQ